MYNLVYLIYVAISREQLLISLLCVVIRNYSALFSLKVLGGYLNVAMYTEVYYIDEQHPSHPFR